MAELETKMAESIANSEEQQNEDASSPQSGTVNKLALVHRQYQIERKEAKEFQDVMQILGADQDGCCNRDVKLRFSRSSIWFILTLSLFSGTTRVLSVI